MVLSCSVSYTAGTGHYYSSSYLRGDRQCPRCAWWEQRLHRLTTLSKRLGGDKGSSTGREPTRETLFIHICQYLLEDSQSLVVHLNLYLFVHNQAETGMKLEEG